MLLTRPVHLPCKLADEIEPTTHTLFQMSVSYHRDAGFVSPRTATSGFREESY
jgi:hypothetical protein